MTPKEAKAEIEAAHRAINRVLQPLVRSDDGKPSKAVLEARAALQGLYTLRLHANGAFKRERGS